MPFAQWKDAKVQLKMEYLNKKHRMGHSHINGRDWYNQECSRAVNQAIGRVIRHINDYGLILLVDKRYGDYKVRNERSKWLRERQVNFDDFDKAKNTINNFFADMKAKNLPMKAIKPIKMFDSDDEVESRCSRNSVESSNFPRNSKIYKLNLNRSF